MELRRWKCGPRLQMLGMSTSLSFIVSCGGHTEAGSSPGGTDATANSLVECLDVVFQSAPDASTGIVACPLEGSSRADLFSSRPEECAGRGLGLPVAQHLCRADADCPDGSSCRSNGFCYGPVECDADSDCGSGAACACAGMFSTESGYDGVIGYNQCLPAECRSDSDCAGYSCGLSSTQPCGQLDGFFCHSNRDVCARSADCGTGLACGYDREGRRWVCLDSDDSICE
jgi:hypothetical protein